jgi:hypothetical protein
VKVWLSCESLSEPGLVPHGFVWLRVPLMALPPPPVRSLASATLNSHLTICGLIQSNLEWARIPSLYIFYICLPYAHSHHFTKEYHCNSLQELKERFPQITNKHNWLTLSFSAREHSNFARKMIFLKNRTFNLKFVKLRNIIWGKGRHDNQYWPVEAILPIWWIPASAAVRARDELLTPLDISWLSPKFHKSSELY